MSPIHTYFAWLPERLTAVLLWSSAPISLMVRCTICRGVMMMNSLVFQNICHIGDTQSAQELEVFLYMSRERLRLCFGLQCLTGYIPMGLVSARSSFMQLSNCYGSPLESRVFVVKMLPSGHFSALKTDMSWLRQVLLYLPCVKGVLGCLAGLIIGL